MVSTSPQERPGRALLDVLVLASFAFSQPLLDLVGRNPQFLVTRRVEPLEVWALAIGLTFGPGLSLALVLWLFRACHDRLGRALQGMVLATLVALIALPVLRRLAFMPALTVLLLACGLGGLGWWAYRAFRPARTFVLCLSPVLVLFPAVFLARSGVRSLLVTEAQAVHPLPKVPAEVPPVVLVVFDEFPLATLLDEEHRIDAVRYPAFAELAKTAHWFRNATTVHVGTRAAIPALLTGRYPEPHESRVANAASYPDNLFTWLGASTEIRGFEPITHLLPDRFNRQPVMPEPTRLERNTGLLRDLGLIYAHAVLPRRLAGGLPQVSQGWKDFGRTAGDGSAKADRAELFRRFVREIEPGPGLFFVHTVLPHGPWEYFPSGRRYGDPWAIPGWTHPDLGADYWADEEALTTRAYQRLLLQVGLADRLLGELLSRLRATGLFDRCLLVVVADHGLVMRPGHAKRGIPGEDLRDELMPVPLLVKEPFQRLGDIDDRNAEITDVVATIADAFGLETPWPTDGASLIASPPPPRATKRCGLRVSDEVPDPTVYPFTGRGYERSLAFKLSTFGSGSSRPDGLFRFGEHEGLIGRRLNELALRDDPAVQVAWEQAQRFAAVELDVDPLPAHIRGVLDIQGAVPRYWAIAVNGTVQAVVPTHRLPDGRTGLSAIVPEHAFALGANRVEAFWVEQKADRVWLHGAAVRSADEIAREAFDTLPDVLFRLDGAAGFDGLEPVAQITFGDHVPGASKALAMDASSGDPQLGMPGLDLAEYPTVGLFIDLESPAETDLQLFYQTASEPRFFVNRMRSRRLAPGRNRVYLLIESAEAIGKLRLDPGRLPGRYRLRALEIRGAKPFVKGSEGRGDRQNASER